MKEADEKKYDSIHHALLAAISDMPEDIEPDKTMKIQGREIKYVSIDKFYRETRKHFLKHGILPVITQTGVTDRHFDPVEAVDDRGHKYMYTPPPKYLVNFKLWFEYFGEKSWEIEHGHLVNLHPKRSAEQQYGGSRSYAWKYIIRSQCMLPTGDPDSDDLAVAEEDVPSTIVTTDLSEHDKLNGARNRAQSAYTEMFSENAQAVATWVLSKVADSVRKEFAHYTKYHLELLWGWLAMVEGHDIRDSVLNAVRANTDVQVWGRAFRASKAAKQEQAKAEAQKGNPVPADSQPASTAPTPPESTAFGDKHLKGSVPEEVPEPPPEYVPKPQTIPDRKAAVANWLSVFGFSGRAKQAQLIEWVLGYGGVTRSTMKHPDLSKFEDFMGMCAEIGDPEKVNATIKEALDDGLTSEQYLSREIDSQIAEEE